MAAFLRWRKRSLALATFSKGWWRGRRASAPFIEGVQRVAYWYGQVALLPAAAREPVLRALDASNRVQRRALLAAARLDVTAMPRYSPVADAPFYPMMH